MSYHVPEYGPGTCVEVDRTNSMANADELCDFGWPPRKSTDADGSLPKTMNLSSSDHGKSWKCSGLRAKI